jgi:hypothetical protein
MFGANPSPEGAHLSKFVFVRSVESRIGESLKRRRTLEVSKIAELPS